jgi:hypothetical protein
MKSDVVYVLQESELQSRADGDYTSKFITRSLFDGVSIPPPFLRLPVCQIT